MPNRLIHETSPYLLQHAHNPVDWYPWGEEALARAQAEDRPIFLSIGYSACHWCHVMERESFENDDIAALMNASFVSVKVDREERPDIDSIYMGAIQAMTGRGGWPLSMFLTPASEPFYGGTYFPPEDRHGMPGFPRVLAAISDAYSQAPQRRGQLREGDHRGNGQHGGRRSWTTRLSPKTPCPWHTRGCATALTPSTGDSVPRRSSRSPWRSTSYSGTMPGPATPTHSKWWI